MAKSRLLVIGLDGSTLRLIERWNAERKLPVFAQLLQTGTSGYLLSTPNKCSPAAWTSMMTGVNPARHGIFFFLDRVPRSYAVKQHTARQQEFSTVWELLSRAGLRVAVGLVPFSTPARPINGIHLGDWFAPSTDSRGFTWPPTLQAEAERLLPCPLTPNVRQPVENGDFAQAVANIQDTLDGKLSVMKWIAREQDWDFGFVAVEEIDAVQHYFWHLMDAKHPDYDPRLANQYGSAIYDVYARIDTEIGDLLDYLGSDINIMVVSDHGGCANDRGNTHLEPWLEAIGLLAEHSASAHGKTESLSRRSLLGVKNWLQRVLPMDVQRRLIRRFSGVVEKTSAWRHLAKYDWAATKAFPFGDSGIFLNVRGREPEGIVGSGEEYETLRWEIKTTLEQSRDPKTEKPLTKRVYFREEEHWGPFIETVPDLLVDWTDDFVMDGIPYTDAQGQQQLAEFVRGSIFPTGVHHREGCIILHGPEFRAGLKLSSPSVLDIAPTILEVMGVAVPPYMEGQPLTEAIAAEHRLREPVVTSVPSTSTAAPEDSAGYSSEEQAAIEERLRNLGYLD